MAWDRRTLSTTAACWLGYALLLSCNGAKFSPSASSAGAGGSSANAGKSNGGAANGGESTAPGGKGGAKASGGSGNAEGGEPDTGAAGQADGGEPAAPISKEGLVYWFEADVGAQGDAGVSKWLDQSGNGFHATQLVAEWRPQLTTTNLLPLPLLAFDGEQDFLELPELETELSHGMSFFAVAGRQEQSACSAFIELSNGPELNDINWGAIGDTYQFEIAAESLRATEGAFPTGEVRLFEVHHTADPIQSLVELRVNGSNAGSGAMAAPENLLRISNFIGRSLYGDCTTYGGGIAELILYARKLSSDERTSVESYLMEKWSCCN